MSFLTMAVLSGSSLAAAAVAHCTLMCGPLALSARVRRGGSATLSYFAGRLVSYTLLGALAGSLGHALLLSPWARWAEAGLSWLFALTLAYTAATLLRGPTQAPLLSLGTKPRTSWVGRLLARVADDPLLLGVATALLPCGALFSALTAAAALGSAGAGAIAMSTFAILTGVAVIGVGQLALRVRTLGTSRQHKRALAVVLALGAIVMLLRPLPMLRESDAPPACHALMAHGSH